MYFPTWFEITDNNNQEPELVNIPDDDESIPNIQFSKQELNKLRNPWKKSLSIQIVDYTKPIPHIEQMLQRIRKLKNKVEVIDLGQGYYVGRFFNPNEYFLALAGGPWFMFQYHFSIQQWVPNFIKKTQYNNKIFIWAQFKNLPIEYFNGDALFKLAQAIGRPIKMDYHTSEVTRGRYARVCIEVDTNIPLPPYVRINSIKQEITYELNAVFCNKCGKIGHFSIKCQASSITEGIIECPIGKVGNSK